MPPYNRIEEPDRWDVINYLRSLQGKIAIAADTSHGRPGETGVFVPGATQMGPTRPAPYHRPGPAAAAAEPEKNAPSDSTKKPEQKP